MISQDNRTVVRASKRVAKGACVMNEWMWRWFISWGMRDSWIICFRSWKFHFPEVFPTITDSKWPETCLPMDSLVSMAFPSRSIIRTWQVIIFDILLSWSWDSQWPLRSALVVYCCSMENEIEILSSVVRFLSLSFFASPADQQLRKLFTRRSLMCQ